LKKDIYEDYAKICNVLLEFGNFTAEEFCKAETLINSRIFGTYINDISDNSYVPYADMFNTKFMTSNAWATFNDVKQVFTITAQEEIPRGSEIFVSYGDHSNRTYLLYYGFVIENNSKDYAQFDYFPENNDPLKEFKEKLLDMESAPYRCKLSRNPKSVKFLKTISYLRFINYEGPKEFLEKLKEEDRKIVRKPEKRLYFMAQNIPILSRENEYKSMRKLYELSKSQLSKYITTIEQDKKLLENTAKLSVNEKNIIIFRKSEKEILKYYMEFSEAILEYYEIKEKSNKIKNYQNEPLFENYIKSITKII